MGIADFPIRAGARVRRRVGSARLRRAITVVPRKDMVAVGDLDERGQPLPMSLLDINSSCILGGVDGDASFGLALIERVGARALAVDPSPRAAESAATIKEREHRFEFEPAALWSEDTTLALADSSVSARSVASLMADRAIASLTLLKISADGAEHEILAHVIDRDLDVRIIAVEYAQQALAQRAIDDYRRLVLAGYDCVAASLRPPRWKLTFVRRR